MKSELKRKLIKVKPLVSVYLFFKRIKNNLHFLLTQDITKLPKQYDMEFLRREIAYELPHTKNPTIKSLDETLDMLINTDKSLCRFGDGEFENILGIPSPFQYKDLDKLSKRLIEVLKSDNSKIAVALPQRMFSGKLDLPEEQVSFWRSPHIKPFFRLIEENCSTSCIYYASEVTLPFCYTNINLDSYFDRIRRIWQGKDITLVANKDIFNGLKYNIFDNTKHTDLINAPKENAFSEYQSILDNALKTDKNSLKIIILGQTATVLSYDLAMQNHRALDLGHIAKAYDWYKLGKLENTQNFFKPD